MWGVEDDPLLRSVILLVCQLDKAPDQGVLQDRIERMSLENPKLRQRAVGNPVSPLPPRWETDPNFDFAYHVRWERLPKRSGNLSDVLEIAETISEQDFDRARPLWEIHVITGLVRGGAAVIVKIHHSITDGVGGMMMAATLFDLSPEPNADLPPKPSAPVANPADVLSRIEQGIQVELDTTLTDFKSSAKAVKKLTGKVVADPMSSLVDAQEFAASAARLMAPASEPLSELWTDRSLSVAFSVIEAELDDLKQAAKAVGGTLNDAFMAAVTGGLAMYHERHGSHPDALRVNMPINVRSAEDSNNGGNAWVPARFAVPVNVVDAADRMRQLHPILVQARMEPALPISQLAYKILSVLPRPITTSIAGSMMLGTDFAATNVPGPPFPLYMARAKITAMIPFAPKGGAAVNVGLMSYDGQVFLGINVDRGAVANPEELTDCIAESLEAVLAVQPSATK